MKEDCIYIAGPMTGLPNFNYDAFHVAAFQWRNMGWTVLNPAESFDGRQDLPYQKYMTNAVELVLRARAIALLPNWQNSKGAQMEVLLGSRFGYEFFDADTGAQIPTPELQVSVVNANPLTVHTQATPAS